MRSAYGKGWICHVQSTVTPFKRLIKLFLLLLVSFHLLAFWPGESQVVTLSFKDAPLQKVFTEIRKQTGYSFAYSETDLSTAKRVNINITNTRIQDALSVLFQNQPLTYTIIERVIIIKAKSEKKINQEQSSLQAFQEIDVKGRVLNEEGDPVAGVSVQVKGTKVGTSTDGDGEFVLRRIDPNATLILTAVNILPIEANINGRNNLDLRVKGKTGKLDEVQVIAYGKTSQRFNTGNVATIKAEDIEKQPVQNPLLALQGRVPGLEVTQNTGVSGGAITIRIQGQNSIFNGLDPLIVIDGVPYPSQMAMNTFFERVIGGGNPLNYINPADIESIDVLKDADATAIYGSRAANGAILITTKKGKAGKIKVTLDAQQGWGKVTRKLDMLNTRQYLDMRYEAYRNDGINWRASNISANDLKVWDTTRYTDWQKELIGGTAEYTNVGLSVSGGTNTIQYLVGATFNRITTVFPGDFDDKRGSVHFNLGTSSVNQRFRMQISGSYMVDNNHLPSIDLTDKAVKLEPNAPAPFKQDGSINWAPNAAGNSTWENPLVYQFYRDFSQISKNLVSNATLSYILFSGLEIKASIGYNNLQTKRYVPFPLASERPERQATSQRYADYLNTTLSSWIIEPQITYNREISKGKLEVLIGSSVQQNINEALDVQGIGYSSDQLLKNLSAATSFYVSSNETKYKYNALFGRANYIWQNKYIINLTARRDGSSRFGDNNRFHNFGSIGIGWVFTQEKPFQNLSPIISFGKLRGTFGTTGNDQIGDYKYLSLYTPIFGGIPYQDVSGLSVVGISNPYLEWEETRKLQLGIDLGFLKDKILLNITYARNRSSNLLLDYSLPAMSGFTGVNSNFPATVQNSSLEITLNTTNVQTKNLTWRSSLNITVPRNKLLDFPNLEQSTYAHTLIIGQPINAVRVYKFMGVDPAMGRYVVADKDGNPTMSPGSLSAKFFLSGFSKFYGGFQNSVGYKGFQLDFLFQFIRQLGTRFYYNGTRNPGQFSSSQSNQPVAVLDRWQKPGDHATFARFSTTGNIGNIAGSDGEYSYGASFVRLKNVSLSWQTPPNLLKKIRLESLRLFLHAQNIVTISGYSGLDPETQSIANLPPLRIITAGFKIGF